MRSPSASKYVRSATHRFGARVAIVVATLAAFPLASFAIACSSDSDDTETPSADLADVNYEAGTTDEALEALLAKSVDASKKVPVTVPSVNQVFPSSPVPMFTWSEAKTASVFSPSPALQFAATKRSGQTVVGSIGTFFSFEKEAFAHGTPVNGPGYFLVFKGGSGNIARVFTTSASYLPTADVWSKLVAAKSVSLTITAGVFEDNALVPGGGPFASASIPFTVTP